MIMKRVNVTLFPFALCAEMSKRSFSRRLERRGKIRSTLIYGTSVCFLKTFKGFMEGGMVKIISHKK